MSVEKSGARLLGEVMEEGFDQILAQIRKSLNPTPTNILGVESLDQLLEIFRFHQAQGTPRRPEWTSPELESPNDDNLNNGDSNESPERPENASSSSRSRQRSPVIEINSHGSAAGKTTLLYFLTAIAILPREHGGKQSAVVWVDTDNKFSSLRLSEIIHGHLSKTSRDLPATDNLAIAHEALDHVHVLRPRSSIQLVSLLHSLPSHLLNTSNHSSAHRSLGLLVLDPATAFHWQDRLALEMARLEAGADVLAIDQPSKTVEAIALLQALQAQFDCAVLFTTDLPPKRRNQTPDRHPHPHEPPAITPWTAFALFTLNVSRVAVPHFTMTIEDCVHDKGKREETVAGAKFVASLDWSARERWGGGLAERLERLARTGGGRVAFSISGAGVEVER